MSELLSVRTYYDEGSMMLSDDVTMLSDLLLGLNCIDFRLNTTSIIMAALCKRAGHYIFALSFILLSFFLLLSVFPCLISAVTDWMSAVLLHMVWP